MFAVDDVWHGFGCFEIGQSRVKVKTQLVCGNESRMNRGYKQVSDENGCSVEAIRAAVLFEPLSCSYVRTRRCLCSA